MFSVGGFEAAWSSYFKNNVKINSVQMITLLERCEELQTFDK